VRFFFFEGKEGGWEKSSGELCWQQGILLFLSGLPKKKTTRMADTSTANKVIATVGGLVFAGSGALLAGKAIQAEADAGKRQLMSAGVIFL